MMMRKLIQLSICAFLIFQITNAQNKNQNNIHDSTQVSVQVSHNGSDSSFVKPATQENIPMKAAVQHPTKWTYRCVCCSTNEIDGYLNDNGAYGWELVAIIANYEPPLKLIFKKPIYE